MNILTTPAVGAPNSFLRRVQVDPTIAMDLLRQIRITLQLFENGDELTRRHAVAQLRRFVNAFEKTHNLTETER